MMDRQAAWKSKQVQTRHIAFKNMKLSLKKHQQLDHAIPVQTGFLSSEPKPFPSRALYAFALLPKEWHPGLSNPQLGGPQFSDAMMLADVKRASEPEAQSPYPELSSILFGDTMVPNQRKIISSS